MNQEPNPDFDLETRLSKDNSKVNLQIPVHSASLLDKVKQHSKYFVADGTACAVFYAPIMAATEYLSGME